MIKIKRIIDLGHPLYHCCPLYPGMDNFLVETVKYAAIHRATNTYIRQMSLHVGTHCESALHVMPPPGRSLDQFPIDKFVGEGVVLNLTFKKPGEEITTEDLERYDKDIREGDVVCLCTGWSKKRGFSREYLFQWPGLGQSAAKYLISKKVRAVGIDGLSLEGWSGNVPGQAPVARTSTPSAHYLMLDAGMIFIEEMNNLDQVLDGRNTARALFIYTAILIQGAEAGPCRPIAIILED